MSEQKLEGYFFTVLFVSVLVLVGILFYPFIGALALAFVLAVLSAPMYNVLVRRLKRPGVTAFLVVCIVTLAVLLPALGLIVLLVDEAMSIAQYLGTLDLSRVPLFFEGVTTRVQYVFPTVEVINVSNGLQNLTEYVGTMAAGVFAGTLSLALKFFIVIIALFFFLRDGRVFTQTLIAMSPLADNEDEQIIRRIKKVTHSLIRGTMMIAILKGLLMGLGFLLFGIPNPVLWGSVTAITALVPTLGTGIVAVPAFLYLLFTGDLAPALGFLAWSVLIVGLVDNILAPHLIGGGARIHPLFILLSVIGGIAVFGISGFLLGPLIIGLLVALADIYQAKVRTMHESFS